MNNHGKFIRFLIAVLLIAVIFTFDVGATSKMFTSYGGYEYNAYGESSVAPVVCVPCGAVNSANLGLKKSLNAPTDMVYDNDSLIYILDAGNNRIVLLNANDYSLNSVFDTFTDKNGAPITFDGANGLDVDSNSNIYIADTKNNRVLIFGKDLKLIREIKRPDEALSGSNSPFDASKVMVGNDGTVYVICKSINTGILTFTNEGEFKMFYGSNNVEATAEVISNYFINKFLTREQRANRANITPTNFSNMTLDSNNFVYTVKSEKFNYGSKDVIQCLNYSGKNILDEEKNIFGELENDAYSYYWNRKSNSFVDIDIDSDNIINVLDSGYGRVYQYTHNGDFIGAFGGLGTQLGNFSNPVAIETVNGKVLVLDTAKNSIITFESTEYGNKLRYAFSLRESTDLDKRLEAWEDVLKLNSNSMYPYYGIGLVYDEKGMYKEAMEQFEIAGFKTEYSKAFKQYRKQAFADNIFIIILVAVALITVIVVSGVILKKKMVTVEGTAYSPLETKWGIPLYALFHPVDAFSQFKDRKIESSKIATIIIAIWFVFDTLSFFFTGFVFNSSRVTDFQLFVEIFKTFGIFILFVVANWAMCTLMNGKGKLKEIYCAVAYSLIPYIVSVIVRMALSNLLTENEGIFLSIITVIGITWSAILICFALITIHEYSFSGMLGSVILSVLAMAVIGFLAVLFYTLMLQVYQFVISVFEEIKLK